MASRSPNKTEVNGNPGEQEGAPHLLESYLAQSKMVAVSGHQLSQPQDNTTGAPQGNVLNPIIFRCFNGLPSVTRSEGGMFTDNCTMFSTICDFTDAEVACVHRQQEQDNIKAWDNVVRNKCQAMTISN